MSSLEVLLVGVGLGVRHAVDADHVVVVSTLLTREPGTWRAARIAALWGAGHTLAFLGVGFAIILFGLDFPPSFELAAERLVAALLVGVGAWHLVGALRQRRAHHHAPALFARPIAIGLAHGLAGSAAIALLAVAAVPSRSLAAVYLCLVALGTILGMVALTVVMARPLAWTARRDGVVRKSVAIVAGGLSVALGLWMLVGPA